MQGRTRRLPAAPPRRAWLDRAEHIAVLLDAAGQLDQHATVYKGQRRALMATLAFASLRIGERVCRCIAVRGRRPGAAAAARDLRDLRDGELLDSRRERLDHIRRPDWHRGGLERTRQLRGELDEYGR